MPLSVFVGINLIYCHLDYYKRVCASRILSALCNVSTYIARSKHRFSGTAMIRDYYYYYTLSPGKVKPNADLRLNRSEISFENLFKQNTIRMYVYRYPISKCEKDKV